MACAVLRAALHGGHVAHGVGQLFIRRIARPVQLIIYLLRAGAGFDLVADQFALFAGGHGGGLEVKCMQQVKLEWQLGLMGPYLYNMKTYAVRAKSKKAEALIEQLVALGVIEAEAMKKPYEHLADVLVEIRSQVTDKLTLEEVAKEVDAVRAKRYAASKKAQVRR
ncbi:MAG TPA: hypothetical protein PLV70_12605 [Flavobacteriales bacterium]|nr:hypothetical protein [Flavobacteriales bacterium]HRP82671.1 hypothetical protein [Flavobacteriales bacterium]HRQ85947.1 hypothetical protein [Flavobacteriales bacterium]